MLWSFEVPIGPQWEGYASAVAVGHVNVFVASANGRILGMARSDGWLAWKRAFADVSEPPGWVIPLDPTWHDDVLEGSWKVIGPKGYQRWRMRRAYRSRPPAGRPKA